MTSPKRCPPWRVLMTDWEAEQYTEVYCSAQDEAEYIAELLRKENPLASVQVDKHEGG